MKFSKKSKNGNFRQNINEIFVENLNLGQKKKLSSNIEIFVKT